MKQGSTIVGPLRWCADRDLALMVGDLCRRSVGLVVLYDPRINALAGTAELYVRREDERQPVQPCAL